jgi:hypothetical protein
MQNQRRSPFPKSNHESKANFLGHPDSFSYPGYNKIDLSKFYLTAAEERQE